MTTVECRDAQVKLSDWIIQVVQRGHEASVAAKQQALQAYVDDLVAREVGRAVGEVRPEPSDDELSSWHCSNCMSRRKADFRYSGAYQRTLAFEDGVAQLRIPRIRCRCGGNVRPDFGAGLPKRKRHWHDLDLTAVELHLEGMGYRGIKRHLGRYGPEVGLGSLSGKFTACAGIDINAGLTGPGPRALSADAAFVTVGSGSRAQYYLHEVLLRPTPLVRGDREVAWHQTGKVLACGFADEETLEGWQQVFMQAVIAGIVDPEMRLGLVSDGNQGLLSAADLWLPWSPRQRCTWHIAHRARDKATEANRDAFERDAQWSLKAPDLEQAFWRLEKVAGRWVDKEFGAVQYLAEKFEQGIVHLCHPEVEVLPRTAGISERYNQELKRRGRAMRGYRSEAGMIAMNRLIALRHNCILDRTDWLIHAAGSLWPEPIPTINPQQQSGPAETPYTIGGT